MISLLNLFDIFWIKNWTVFDRWQSAKFQSHLKGMTWRNNPNQMHNTFWESKDEYECFKEAISYKPTTPILIKQMFFSTPPWWWELRQLLHVSIIVQHIYFQISKKSIQRTSNFISLSKFENICYMKSTKLELLQGRVSQVLCNSLIASNSSSTSSLLLVSRSRTLSRSPWMW